VNKEKENSVTHSQVVEAFHYDIGIGELFWRERLRRRQVLNPAGNIDKTHGYRRINWGGSFFTAHRLIWFHQTGAWPIGEIDHIDGNRANNRISNLRDVSMEENRKNKKMYKRNKSGHCGVYWRKDLGKWQVSIRVDGTLKHLGCFIHKGAAVSIREAAEKQYGFHKNHGRNNP